MPNTKNPGSSQNASHERGGSREQHVQAGEQSHGGTAEKSAPGSSQRGGSHERHVKAGEQSHK